MSAKKLPWFRMYCDFLEDPKMVSLAFEDQRHFIGILALKSAGVLDQDFPNPDLLDRIVAQKLWIDHAIIRDVKRRLVGAGLIDSEWQPLAWEKRQCLSDQDNTAAERKRRQREKDRQQNQQIQHVESGNSSVTRDVTVESRVTSQNVTRLDTDTELDKDKEEKQKPLAADASQAKPSSARKSKISFDYETGQFSGVTEFQLELWRTAYPAISLDTEKAKAAAWLLANPANRKSNIAAFLTRWFTKAQDSAPSRGHGVGTTRHTPTNYGESGRL